MLLERIVKNSGGNGEADADDFVDVEWWELDRRALRKTTHKGHHMRILLPLGPPMKDNDVLSDAAGEVKVKVRVIPCEVLVARPCDLAEMGELSLELGNLHIPAEVLGETIRVISDGPAEAILVGMGVQYERQLARFQPRRCVGMPEVRISSELRVMIR